MSLRKARAWKVGRLKFKNIALTALITGQTMGHDNLISSYFYGTVV